MAQITKFNDGGIDRTAVGAGVTLSEDAEIDAAFTARTAIEDLGPDAKRRVLTWVAKAFDLTE